MKKGNIITALAFAALAGYVIWECSGFPPGKGRVPGPAVFPTIVAALMLMSSLALIINSLRMAPGDNKVLGLLTDDHKRVYVCMGLMIAYVVIMENLGFCAATSVMLFGLIRWFGKYRFHYCALSAFAVTGVVYYVFNNILLVPFRFGVLM